MIRRTRIVVAYDGTSFEGWQSQPGGNTIQDHLESAITSLVGEAFQGRVHGSGRTDSGVHALGQVAHFDCDDSTSLRGSRWRDALNTRLPETIRVMDAGEAKADYHARFSATGKTYRYRLVTGEVPSPLQTNRAWKPPGEIDRERLEAALAVYVGEHDFAGFAANRGARSPEPESTVRKIRNAAVFSEPGLPDGLRLEFCGDGFLYKMVRLLVGAAVHVATGKSEITLLEDALARPTEEIVRICAPPGGLYLVEVEYGNPNGRR